MSKAEQFLNTNSGAPASANREYITVANAREYARLYHSEQLASQEKECALPLTREDVVYLIMNAYQRGYEDRDFDIGYASNRPSSLEEIDSVLRKYKAAPPKPEKGDDDENA